MQNNQTTTNPLGALGTPTSVTRKRTRASP